MQNFVIHFDKFCPLIFAFFKIYTGFYTNFIPDLYQLFIPDFLNVDAGFRGF